tara:strand:- start:58 stop:432 length:375 start_codon:yes stop_codon:yes gene_type:complete
MDYLNILEPKYKKKYKRGWYNDRTFICASITLLLVLISLIFHIYIAFSVKNYINQTNIESEIENAFQLVNQIEDTTGEYQQFLIQAQKARYQIIEIALRVNETNTMISDFIHSVCREYPNICSI